MLMKLKQKKNKNYLRQKIYYNIYVAIFFTSRERVIICWQVTSGDAVDIILRN